MNTILAVSNSTIVWSIIALFLVGAFLFRIVESLKTVKKMESAYKAKTEMNVAKNNDFSNKKSA